MYSQINNTNAPIPRNAQNHGANWKPKRQNLESSTTDIRNWFPLDLNSLSWDKPVFYIICRSFQFPWRPRQTRKKGLYANGTRYSADQGENHRDRWGPLLLQESQLQVIRCRRTAVRAEKMDPLFWRCNSNYLLRGHERVWSSASWRWNNRKYWKVVVNVNRHIYKLYIWNFFM